MKLLLTIAAFFICSFSLAQGVYTKSATNNIWNRAKWDSVAVMPRDTTATNVALYLGVPVGDFGRFAAKDTLMYFHNGQRNKRIAFYEDLTTGPAHNWQSVMIAGNTTNTDVVMDGGSGKGRMLFSTSNAAFNRFFSQTTDAGAYRPILFLTGGFVVSNYSGSSPVWDGASSLQVNGIGAFAGTVSGLAAEEFNDFVTRQQVTDTITARLSSYYPGIPTFQQVTTAGNSTTNTVVIGNHTFGTSRVLINSAVDDGASALQVNGIMRTGNAAMQDDGTGNAVFGVLGSNHTIFYTNSAERMRITPAGNVGIGVTNPINKLVLPNASGAIAWKNSAGTGEDAAIYVDGSNNLNLYNGGSIRQSILPNGNIGIGITTPTSTLHVNGTFATGIYATDITNDYSVLATDPYMTYVVDNVSASTTIDITLPSAGDVPGRIYWFKIKTGGGGNPVNIGPGSVNLVTGTGGPGGPLCILQSNGTNWQLLQGF